MSAPNEIVAQPFTLWLAAVGTAFPTVDQAPGGGWTKIGTSGDLNYTEEGVTVAHDQSTEVFRALGSAGPRKAFRTEEDMRISLTVADLTLEQYALALEYGTVATTAPGVGTSGYKTMGLSRGLTVNQRALLVRGAAGSSYGDGWVAQFEVPVCVQTGAQEVSFTKGEPAALALEFTALEDPSASTPAERFGRLIMANSDPGT